jgi:hypothetical protein
MLDIATIYTYYSGVFPYYLAVNASGAFATDGTEFLAEMVNDYMFGVMQTILDYTGQTPNGILEGPGSSQFLEGLRRAFSHPGEIIIAAWNQDPALLGIRAIKLIGQGVLRSNYQALDISVYCGDPNNATAPAFYHADDAAGTIRNISGNYLILPDCRGQVIRALDTAGVVDPDGPSRKLGSTQGFAIENFGGDFNIFTSSAGYIIFSPTGVFSTGPGLPAPPRLSVAGSDIAEEVTFDASGDAVTSTETRMTNIAFDIYIRY